MGKLLVWLQVVNADGETRTLWEDADKCLTNAHKMQQGKITLDGRPTRVSALVCVRYAQDNPSPHIHTPVAEECRWTYTGPEGGYDAES